MQKIKFVTGNAKKLEEVVNILLNSSYEIIGENIDLPEYQGENYNHIVKEKCKAALQITKAPTIVEDTSLCFKALNGLPGPYVKWFLSKIGTEGLYKMLSSWEDKSAVAVCLFAYSSGNNEEIQVFEGQLSGIIVRPRGPTDFGWDACFQPDGYNITLAEMTRELKNTISHRRKALDIMKNYLNQIFF